MNTSHVWAGLIAGLILAGPTGDVPAAVKFIDPTGSGRETSRFQPSGLHPRAIRRARLVDHGRPGAGRRIPAAGVRRAIREQGTLVLAHSSSIRRPRLRVSLRQPVPAHSCRFGNFGDANLPDACWRPYSRRSPFNTPISLNSGIHPRSAQIVQRLVGFGQGPSVQDGGNAETAKDWRHPIYFSEPDDPAFKVRCVERWRCEVDGRRVQIPNAARPAGANDAHLGVIDQRRGWEYGFYGVRSKPRGGGTLRVLSGGRTRIGRHRSTGLGSNATAAQFGLAAGVIRPAELARGRINHALFMGVHCTNGINVPPADPNRGSGRTCAERGLSNVDAPALGQHFFLDMSLAEIDALFIPTWQRTILHAMARYGMYVGDTGGAPWTVQFESGTSYTSLGYRDPWLRLGARFGVPRWFDRATGRHVRLFDMHSAVDWGRELRVLRD